MQTQTQENRSYYMTTGKKTGRLMHCKIPFNQGKGVFYFTTRLEDWEQVDDQSMSAEDLQYYIDKFTQLRIEKLKNTVDKYKDKGFYLVEHRPGLYQIMTH